MKKLILIVILVGALIMAGCGKVTQNETSKMEMSSISALAISGTSEKIALDSVSKIADGNKVPFKTGAIWILDLDTNRLYQIEAEFVIVRCYSGTDENGIAWFGPC